MEVYVIRHTPVAVGKDTCYGQSNVALSPSFPDDAEQFKNQLPGDFDAVYCSPLQRCKDLAHALNFENTRFDNALMEVNFGTWENQKWNDIDQEALQTWMNDFVKAKPPQGESLLELFERVKLLFDRLRKEQHRKILVITHSGVIRCLWSYLLEIPLQHIFKIPVAHNEIFICKLTENPMTDSIKRTR